MKHLFSLIFALVVTFTVGAQTVTLNVNQSDPLQINTTKTIFTIRKGDQQTLGGDLTLSGGTAPYQVSWRNAVWGNDSVQKTITVSPADTTAYTCKVIDAIGCITEQLFRVNVIFPVVLDVTVTPISCHGKQNGAITLNISDGAKPYTIIWSDGSSEINRTGLGAGTYAVTVTDAMNQQQDTTITLAEQARIEVALTAMVCEGGSYSFNNEELTTEGSYTAAFQSVNGCDSVVTLNLSVNAKAQSSVEATICQGETYSFGINKLSKTGVYVDSMQTTSDCDSVVTLYLTVNPIFENTETAAICLGETYLFAGEQLTSTGQYSNKLQSVTGCDSIINLSLTVNPLPETPLITQSGNTLSSSATSGNQWWKDGAELTGETGSSLEITTSGDYSVTVTNNTDCSQSSANYNIIYTEIDSYEASGILCNIFPNPNNGIFTVDVETNQSEQVQLEFIAVDGKILARQQFDAGYGKHTILFGKENVAKGVYTLRIQSGTKTVNKKLVIN